MPPGVARTALGVARVRAAESARPDRLFDDPFASAFVAAAPPPADPADSEGPVPVGPRASTPADPDAADVADVPGIGMLLFHLVIRTRFYDDYLLGAAAAGCRQVVLMAAGLDCRAFRLPWPDGLRLFELDQPEVLDFKKSVLRGLHARPHCQRTAIPVDLRGAWAGRLTEAGFDPARPAAWLIEGLLIYLSKQEAERLLTEVSALSCPGSRLALERGGSVQRLISETRATARGARLAALWRGGLGEDHATWLGGRGWQANRHATPEVAAGYGRPAPAGSRGGFVTATRTSPSDDEFRPGGAS